MENNKLPDKLFVGHWIKKNGRLVFKSKQEEDMFHLLSKNMREGQLVSFSVDFAEDQGRLSQIAKLKAGTKEISNETGETFINIEQKIKKDAGLYDELTKEYKSFGNCSIQELSSAIQVLLELGTFVGINLNKK